MEGRNRYNDWQGEPRALQARRVFYGIQVTVRQHLAVYLAMDPRRRRVTSGIHTRARHGKARIMWSSRSRQEDDRTVRRRAAAVLAYKLHNGRPRDVSRNYLTGPGRKVRRRTLLAGAASEKSLLWHSLWALVNDQDVLEVETGLDDKEMVPCVGGKNRPEGPRQGHFMGAKFRALCTVGA